MYKTSLQSINRLQEGRLLCMARGNGARQHLQLDDAPPRSTDGMYWLYTSHTEQELRSARASTKKGAVSIGLLAAQRKGLQGICRRAVGKFRVVYNGVGGLGKKGAGGLRERILEELRGGEGTGSLALCDTSLNDLSRWRYSYVLWSEIDLVEAPPYSQFSKNLETLWRLQFGWPILCRR